MNWTKACWRSASTPPDSLWRCRVWWLDEEERVGSRQLRLIWHFAFSLAASAVWSRSHSRPFSELSSARQQQREEEEEEGFLSYACCWRRLCIRAWGEARITVRNPRGSAGIMIFWTSSSNVEPEEVDSPSASCSCPDFSHWIKYEMQTRPRGGNWNALKMIINLTLKSKRRIKLILFRRAGGGSSWTRLCRRFFRGASVCFLCLWSTLWACV